MKDKYIFREITKEEIPQMFDLIVCGAVLKEEDDRWPDDGVAVYLHNFATKIGEKGIGAYFLECVEAYAIEKNKDAFRLDSAIDNDFLSKYYEEKGFMPVGTCIDGLYEGILREKKLK